MRMQRKMRMSESLAHHLHDVLDPFLALSRPACTRKRPASMTSGYDGCWVPLSWYKGEV